MQYYSGVLALHIVAVIAWMAGLLYLPRLFVYHTGQPVGEPLSETFKIMEHRLFVAIMTPAMVVVLLSGSALVVITGYGLSGWFHAKVLLVAFMTGIHFYLGACLNAFAHDANRKSARFFRFLNEAPTLLMIGIVILVVVKPF